MKWLSRQYDSRREISEGKSISVPLETAAIFDSMFTQMIAIGEKAGA